MDEICLLRHSIDCTPSVYVYTAFNFSNTAETNSFTKPQKNGKNLSAETVLCSESYADVTENSKQANAVCEATFAGEIV